MLNKIQNINANNSSTQPNTKGNHLPGYSGHIGGKDMEYKDDVLVKFEPHTVLRTQQPKEPEPNLLVVYSIYSQRHIFVLELFRFLAYFYKIGILILLIFSIIPY